MITVTNEVNVYELDGKDLPVNEYMHIVVTNHWAERRRVNIIINGQRLTVVASDLITAINNAINSNQ